ncbi:hypothetical protein BFW01_g858 [Lasiodiplodia theobromae]|uniref:Protein NO VEIN C-terminal domain-containing protein n=1 Tax=Lasiodiplodia theobromae TaxID=45133 RepID=A0A8H7IRK3_9PEZI|nr:hypothetical protein BFW01_g858 [Lasiodiplodia theobromae]
MSKRGTTQQLSRDGSFFGDGSNELSENDKPRQATAAQLVKRKLKPLKGRPRVAPYDLARDAQKWVAKIRRENGGVSREVEAGMKRDYPEAWEVLQSVRRKLGSAAKTLATDLYSKDTQYLYELIQNADDNQYTRAEANAEEPYICFSLYPDQLVIDCNEDGFTAENVKAICGIGQSTKTAPQGCVGEKGIGFKSVFKIAQRVHIQSGFYSFSFEHTRDSDDEGLGMVTPMTEPFKDLPKDVITRITLTLLSSVDLRTLVDELSNVPDTLLLFVKKLRSILVNIYPETGDSTQLVYSCPQDPARGFKTVEKQSRSNDGEWIVEKRHFRVTRRTIKGLPHDTSRKQTEADVLLAFPVNETGDEAILQGQHVFAYSPIRPVGFNFLIQSDFITQAGREVVVHSPRNKALLSGVAKTFRDAVLEFCAHKKLQYQWMSSSTVSELGSSTSPTSLTDFRPISRDLTQR